MAVPLQSSKKAPQRLYENTSLADHLRRRNSAIAMQPVEFDETGLIRAAPEPPPANTLQDRTEFSRMGPG